ncbi:MAG: hypothetical protein ACTH0N_12330, partial [Brevibacterium aurantiacum]
GGLASAFVEKRAGCRETHVRMRFSTPSPFFTVLAASGGAGQSLPQDAKGDAQLLKGAQATVNLRF